MSKRPVAAHHLHIRTAAVADAALVAELAERIFVRTFGPDNQATDIKAYTTSAFGENIQAREIADADNTYLLMEIDGTVGAFALLRRGATDLAVSGADPVEIQRLYVDHDFHGSGVADQLMDACVTAARELGGLTLWLAVWENNPRAIRFYEKCGFVDVGSHPFMLGTDAQTDRVMSRSIAALSSPVPIRLDDAFAKINEHWQPHIAGTLNGQHVKLAKFKGPFIWHHHEHEDELFLVHRGAFAMEFRDRTVTLGAGDFLIVPRGVEHRPVAEQEVEVLLFEPVGTLNTGNVLNERTVDAPKYL